MESNLLLLLALYNYNSMGMFMLMAYYRKYFKKRKFWVRPIFRSRHIHGYNAALLSELRLNDHGYYKDFMRMTPEIFDELLFIVEPQITKKDTRWRDAISPKDRLAITLRFLATGETYRSLSYAFRVGRSTVSLIVRETCQVIWNELKNKYMKFPQSSNEWHKIAQGFESRWQMPHCCGAIDGKHVIMECPEKTGSLNFNYKGSFSKVLMAVADYQYRFIAVDFGHFGGENDASIFSNCTFGRHLNQNKLNLPNDGKLPKSDIQFPFYFVGDEAFPLKKNLLRPYPRRSIFTHYQRIYNYRLSRARRIVENAFGILASRFRIFRRPLKNSEDSVNKMVMATLVLHNFLIEKCSVYCPPQFADTEDTNHDLRLGHWHENDDNLGLINGIRFGSNMHDHDAKDLRDTLAKYFCDSGAVEWQDGIVYRH